MQAPVAFAIFIACVAVMSWASLRLTVALESIGARLRFSEGLLGIVAALGANAPEICSAFVAMLHGKPEFGLGVVLGSNIFNLAGLLGLSALVAGQVAINRQSLWLNGAVSLVASAVVVALVLSWIPAWSSLMLLALVFVPYVAILAIHPPRIERLRLPPAMKRFFSAAVGRNRACVRGQGALPNNAHRAAAWAIVSVGIVVASSVGAVRTAVFLGALWGIGEGITGMLVLAALTSVPNVIAAMRLAREGRGSAVVSEALNSNTLNILAGLCLPALLIGFAPPSPLIVFAAFWLVGMKLFALAVASHSRGLRREAGAALLALYAAFAVATIYWG